MTKRSVAKVLLVDDNAIVREVFRASLESAGYGVATLDSALRLNQAIRDEAPDLILLDISMPALSGDKAAAFVRQRRFGSDIPILLFSDQDEDKLARIASACGASGFVRKSPDHSGLLAAISRHLVLRVTGGEADSEEVPGL
ncbi:MAG: response regulator [Acidobacteriota bacterium]